MLKKKEKDLTSEEQTNKQSEQDDSITADKVLKMILHYAAVLAVVVLIFGHVLMLSMIPSGSMEGTIMTGDILISTRFDKKDVQRYDIMIFIPPDEPDTYYIKRVIGLPGETIQVFNGQVYADGELLDSSFVPEGMNRGGDGEYRVPEDCYFMMGDNRNHSLDARYWNDKYVPLENIVAKARFIVFPFTRIGSLSYQSPAEGNAAAASEPAPGGDGENHVWTMEQESGGGLELYCQGCGERRHLNQLQVKEDPSDGCTQHRIVFAEVGHAEKGENGMEWVVDSVSLYCNDCDWSATAVPAD